MSEHDELIEGDEAPQPKTEPTEEQKAAELLRIRIEHYSRVFSAGNCTADDIAFVMADLSKFCCAFKSTFHADPRVSANLDGRREVFLRILDFTRLDVETLFHKYNQGF